MKGLLFEITIIILGISLLVEMILVPLSHKRRCMWALNHLDLLAWLILCRHELHLSLHVINIHIVLL